MLRRGEEGNKGRGRLIYICVRQVAVCACASSLTGGYQGWGMPVSHILHEHCLGKYVRIHVWHCSNIQTHTGQSLTMANNVSESLTPVSPLTTPAQPMILNGNNRNETNLSKKLLRRKPSMSACGVLAGKITENHFHYETSDNQEEEQGGKEERKRKKRERKTQSIHRPPIIRHVFN